MDYKLDPVEGYILGVKNDAPIAGKELRATANGIRVLESGPPEVMEPRPAQVRTEEQQKPVRPQPPSKPAETAEAPKEAEPEEVSLRRLVEKWRLAWEQGDLPGYIACYHPEFKLRGMDLEGWKRYKQKLFKREAGRNVEISNISVDLRGSSAVVSFEQTYRTARHRDYGLKTLDLRRHNGRWAIYRESWKRLPRGG
jgi:hypothetical protein